MKNLRVALGDRSYDIVIKKGSLEEIGAIVSQCGLKGRVAMVTNPTVKKLHGATVAKSLSSAGFEPFFITVPDGERYKNLKSLSAIFDALVARRCERSTPVLALGGGVIGDLAGFAAATYLRGVPFVQVPTTLLSQVDSSVGGKTGVNHPKGKNLIGAFYQPKVVVIDPDALKTLPKRELRSGFAEVIKYGVIWDAGFLKFIERKTGEILALGPAITAAIRRSCAIKAEIVGADERESGLRAILNFGHTFGHAIEANAGYGVVRHGEAVGIGMIMAARLSESIGVSPLGIADRIEALARNAGLPVALRQKIGLRDMLKAIKLDKKVSDGRIRFVLQASIGKVKLHEVDEPAILDFLRYKGK